MSDINITVQPSLVVQLLNQAWLDANQAAKTALDAYHAAMIAEYPIKIGAWFYSPKKEQYCRVTKLKVEHGNVCLYGRMKLKNGSLGAVEYQLYRFDHWEKCEPPTGLAGPMIS